MAIEITLGKWPCLYPWIPKRSQLTPPGRDPRTGFARGPGAVSSRSDKATGRSRRGRLQPPRPQVVVETGNIMGIVWHMVIEFLISFHGLDRKIGNDYFYEIAGIFIL